MSKFQLQKSTNKWTLSLLLLPLIQDQQSTLPLRLQTHQPLSFLFENTCARLPKTFFHLCILFDTIDFSFSNIFFSISSIVLFLVLLSVSIYLLCNLCVFVVRIYYLIVYQLFTLHCTLSSYEIWQTNKGNYMKEDTLIIIRVIFNTAKFLWVFVPTVHRIILQVCAAEKQM